MSETYVCQESFEIITNGANHIIEEIEIKAPTARMYNFFSRLEGLYEKAQLDIIKLSKTFDKREEQASTEAVEAVESEKEKIDGILQIFSMSDMNLSSCYDILREILTHKKCGALLNGEIELKTGHWDDIPMKELKRILGFYILNFIVSSD